MYTHQDHLQSASLQTNIDGSVVSFTTYQPFGSIEYQSGEQAHDYTYTDQEQDPNTRLLYCDARYYDSDLGKLTSVDLFVVAQ